MSPLPIPSTTSADELLRHAAWVRRVARALVRGHDRVDEVEQETWAAALAHPPRDDSDPRRWLAGVARNVARHLFRSDERRRRHESSAEIRASARRPTPATDEIVARAEMQQRVAAAVLALAEPYRSTLLARYFDDMSPTLIACALEVSAETVKTRLKRGLAQLRERLDAERGDAPTLEAALAPLVAPIAASVVPTGAKVAVVAAILVAAISLTILLQSRPATSREVSAPVAIPRVAETPVVAAAPDAAPRAEPAVVQATRAPDPPAPPEGQVAAKTAATVHLVGRILLPDGTPAANVALQIHGWESNHETVLRYGLPKNWSDFDRVSATDGTFAIEFEAPLAYQFTLDTKLAGHAAACWRWGGIEAGTTKQLGDVTLRKAATIRGRIVDARGFPVHGGAWTVHANGPRCTKGDGADETRVHAVVDSATSQFFLENVPSGRVKLTAYSKIANWIEGPTVDVVSGEEVTSDVTYSGADLSQRITVTLFSRPFYIFEMDAEEIVLSGPGLESHRAHHIEGSSQSHCFDDVPPGQFTVEVRDPKFLPWKKDGVIPGSAVSAHLVGNARIRLQVVDAATGTALSHYSLRVRFEKNCSPNTFDVLQEADDPPQDGTFAGLIPENQTLLVRADGYAECAIPERPLAANQVTEVTARLIRGGSISGVVVRFDGTTPAPGTRIFLALRDSGGNALTMRLALGRSGQFGGAPDERDVVADAQGSFRFSALPTGHYSLCTDDELPLQASIDDVEVAGNPADVTGVKLILPPRGFVVGHLHGPDGADFSGLRVVAFDPTESDRARLRRKSRRWMRTMRDAGPQESGDSVRTDGAFRIGPLGVGEVEVQLELALPQSPEGGGSFSNMITSGEPVGFELGKAKVVEGQETNVDFDVHETLPGRVHATITMNGRPAVGAIVEVVRAPDPANEIERLNGPKHVAIGAVGPDGTVTLGPVPVGSASLVVRALDRVWAYWPRAPLQMPAGGVVETSAAYTLYRGPLVVKDRATGKPLASTQFSVGCEEGGFIDYVVSVDSNANGVVHLRLAPGTYRICATATVPDGGAPFEWTAQGATVGTVELASGH